MNIKLIKTEYDYDLALERINKIFEAKPNSNEANELNILVNLVEQYEQIHYPIPEPEIIESIKFMQPEKKIIFFLVLSQQIVSKFDQTKNQEIAQKALDDCWIWLQEQKDMGYYLYNLLDNEDDNSITILQEISENELDVSVWNCIIDSVAYTSRKAYEKENTKYFPEPITLVDDELLNHFVKCFNQCVLNSKKYISNLASYLQQYKIDRNYPLKEEILKNLF
jgi:antitoxin component HigA of HigAB toxin-antitoxin module